MRNSIVQWHLPRRSSSWPKRALSMSYSSRSSGSPEHNDLPSFLAYASRMDLSPSSTVYVGTHYEYQVMQSLVRLGFKLSRTGGRLDEGIDLLGTWNVPTLPFNAPLHILLQCKALNRKAGPNLIRELEGTFAAAPAAWKEATMSNLDELSPDESITTEAEGGAKDSSAATWSSGIMALLVAPKEATKGVRDAMGRSKWPMGYVKVTQSGNVEQLLWNKSAASRGLQGLSVTTRFKPTSLGAEQNASDDNYEGEGPSVKQEIVLSRNGQVWQPELDLS